MHEPLVIGKLIVLALGLFIAYQAYEGYRRHGSVAMFYLAIGFALISVGTILEGALFELLGLDIFVASAIQTVIVALGMLVVLYSLYGNHARRVPMQRDSTE